MAVQNIQSMVKRALRYTAVAVGAAALVLSGFLLWLSSSSGRAWVASELSAALDSTDIDIDVARIDGSLFSEFTMIDVTAKDNEGQFLNAPNITVSWTPFALLGGTVEVSKLSSGGVNVARLPITTQTERSESGGAGGLPVAIKVDEADIAVVFQGEPYRATARQVRVAEVDVRGNLSLTNDDRSDIAEAMVTWNDEQESFTVEGDVRARAGGLITGLLGLDDRDSLTAGVEASGTVQEWNGTLTAEVPQKLVLNGEASGSGGVWKGAVTLEGNTLLPDDLQALVAEQSEIKFQVTPQRDKRLLFSAELVSGGLLLEAEGDGKLEGGASFRNVAVTLESQKVRLAELAADGVKVSGTLNYEDGHLALGYHARADGLTQNKIALSGIDTTGTLQMNAGRLSGTVEQASLDLQAEDMPALPIAVLTAQWSYKLGTRALAVRAASLKGEGVAAHDVVFEYAQGQTRALDAELQLSAAFLSPWVGEALKEGALDAVITSKAAESGLVVQAEMRGRAFRFEDGSVQALVGAMPNGTAELYLPVHTSENIQLKAARLAGAGFDTQLSGAYVQATDHLDLSVDGTLGREGHLNLDTMILSGEAKFKARLRGPTKALSLDLMAGIDAFEGYGVSLNKPQLSASLSPDARSAGHWVGNVALEGGTPLGPTTLVGDLKASKEAAAFENIKLSAPGAIAEGMVAWSQSSGISGGVEGRLQSIEDQSFDLKGDALLAVQLKTNGGEGEVAARFDAEGVSFIRQGHFPITLGGANGEFSFEWGVEKPGYRASFTGQGLTYGAQSLDVISVQGNSKDGEPLLAELSGYWGSRYTLSASVVPMEGGADAEFLATYGTVAAATKKPVQVRWPFDGALSIQAEALDLAGGNASASITRDGQQSSARIKLEGADFTAINLLQPGVLETGSISAELVFDRNEEGETGHAAVDFSNITLPQWRVAAAPDVYNGSVTAELREGALILKGGISEASREFGQLTGNLPYQRKEDGAGYEIRPDTPLALDLTWRGDVAPVWLFARRPSHLLTGTLDGNLSLSGDLGNPTFKGRLELTDGHYEYEPLGLVAEITELSVEGTQDHIELASLKATDGNGGKLTGQGEFELSSALSFPGTLSVEMTDFRVARLDEIGGTASASLVYQRAEEFTTLTGQVTTGKMQVAMPRELPRSVVEIDVIEINGEEELEAAQAQAVMQRSKPTQLAISVDVPGQFFFEGRGLQSEWEGDLLLSGTTDEPEVSGTMQVKNGVFNFGSKAFDITDGRLMFLGTSRIDPDIAVTAVHKTATIEAQLQITGAASAPKIELNSIPDMPDDEIMARVLLGKSVSDLTALQLAELVGAMDTLRGGGSLDVVGRLRRGLGLDTLSLNKGADDDDGATTITGGKYLRKNIYLEVETSTVSSETATRLKIDISKNLLAETELGARQGSSLKLKWFWEY